MSAGKHPGVDGTHFEGPEVDPLLADEIPDARHRLEEAIGYDLTRLLLNALAGGYRPERRGRSSP